MTGPRFRPELIPYLAMDRLVRVPRKLWGDSAGRLSVPPDEVWLSGEFLVHVYPDSRGARRITVCRAEKDEDGEWIAGLTWDDLMRVKREVGRGDEWAVEVFPAEDHRVEVANMRHLWIVPEAPPWAWTRGS